MELIPIEKIEGDQPLIYKEKDAKTYFRLLNSIKKFGQLRPVLVKKSLGKYFIIEGRKIYKALLEDQKTMIWAKVLPNSSPDGTENGLNGTDLEASLVLNELSFGTDYVELGKLFKALSPELNAIPFDERRVKILVEMIDFKWEDLAKLKDANQISLF